MMILLFKHKNLTMKEKPFLTLEIKLIFIENMIKVE
jgi:hypothetical protein